MFKAIADAFSEIVILGKYQSGQMGQTVNLLAYAFGGSNPSLPTVVEKENANQPRCSLLLWGKCLSSFANFLCKRFAEVAQSVEH